MLLSSLSPLPSLNVLMVLSRDEGSLIKHDDTTHAKCLYYVMVFGMKEEEMKKTMR